MSSECLWKDRRGEGGLKKVLPKIMAENFPSLIKDINLYLKKKKLSEPKQDKSKVIHPKAHDSQTPKNKRRRKKS